MATTTNYAIDLLTDTDYADEDWCQLLAYLLSSPLGNFLKELAKGGVLTGWTLGGTGTSTATVAAGTGLVNGCMGKTTTSTNLTGLTSGAVNYIYAQVDATSHTDARTIDFVASLSPNNPAGTVRLGSVTVAAGGTITAVDDNPTAYPRDYCTPLRTRVITGTEYETVTVGEEAVFLVDHSATQSFLTSRPSTVRITSADPAVHAWAQIIDGDSFYLHVWNNWSAGYAYGYGDTTTVQVTWERVGYVA